MEAGAPVSPYRATHQSTGGGRMKTEGAIPRLRVTDVRSPRAAFVPSRGLRVYYARMLLPSPLPPAPPSAPGPMARTSPTAPSSGARVGRGPTRERVAYLTFDDGPNPAATEPILETLAASNVPAAFFLVGEHVRRFPAAARQVAAARHEIGNHTLRHESCTFRDRAGSARSSSARTSSSSTRRAESAQLPRAPRVPQSFRGRRYPTSRLHGVSVGRSACGTRILASPRTRSERAVRRKLRRVPSFWLHDGDGYDPHGDRSRTAAALPGIIADARAAGYASARFGDLVA